MRSLQFSQPNKILAVASAVLALNGCSALANSVKADSRQSVPSSLLGAPMHEDHVLSLWDKGVCTFSGGYVTYANTKTHQNGEVKLDVTVFKPQNILCSDVFTVVFDNDFIVVALGASKVLDGYPSLGFLGENYIPANSYQVKLKPVLEDGGVASSNIENNALVITSANGSTWKLDLTNPFAGWKAY